MCDTVLVVEMTRRYEPARRLVEGQGKVEG